MGLFDALKGAVLDANAAAQSGRLTSDVEATLKMIDALHEQTKTEALMHYIGLRAATLERWHTWSLEGRLKAAETMRVEARKNKDFDVGIACGYFLASAWLESSARATPQAQAVHRTLSGIADSLEQALHPEPATLAPLIGPAASEPAALPRPTVARDPDFVRKVRNYSESIVGFALRSRSRGELAPTLPSLIEQLVQDDKQFGIQWTGGASMRQLCYATTYGVIKSVAGVSRLADNDRRVRAIDFFEWELNLPAEEARTLVDSYVSLERDHTTQIGRAIEHARYSTNRSIGGGTDAPLFEAASSTFGERR
ncbi:hypothetical protein [Rhizobacter fulvus]